MGRFFTSFDEAWQFFLHRDNALEDFFDAFPEEKNVVLAWLLRLDPNLGDAVARVQGALSHLDWVTPLRPDFLHVALSIVARDDAVGEAQRAWADVRPFDLHIRRINCFHDAVVAETDDECPRELVTRLVEAGISSVRLDTFLPHLTLGVFNAPGDVASLRAALVPLRETVIGRQHVDEVTLCLIPASRTTILDAWEVVGSVAFGAT